jgi:hypothetical protein
MENSPKKECFDRAISILEDIDTLKEDLKEFYKEIKAREDSLGFSPKELREAVALYRKGPRLTVENMQERLDFLRACRIEEATKLAFT